jgi:hypothetical protein
MEKSEQRFVVKFLFLKGLGSKAIHTELTAVLGSTVYSLPQIKIWHVRFATGDLSCEDYLKPGRSPHVLGKALSDFFEHSPFASAGVIAEHFGQSKHIIKEILERELGLRRFSRKWVPHSLSDLQKADRKQMAINLLAILRRQAVLFFIES